jgi:hypothetical protein
MPRIFPKSLSDAKFGSLWRNSRRFVARPVRISPSNDAHLHFSGGPSSHKGSVCPNCKRRLTLFWDIDLSDKLLPDELREGYAPSTRLPFYICSQCLAASYSVLSDTKIATFKFDFQTDFVQADESPFGDAPPDELERRPIAFHRIPTTIDALLTLADMIGTEELDESARIALQEYLGEEVRSDWNLPISQFGGTALGYQGHRNMVCPNSKCPASGLKHPYGELVQQYLMKEMALIHWKDEPILSKVCFQLVYHVCAICFSIRAEYRCD